MTGGRYPQVVSLHRAGAEFSFLFSEQAAQ